MPPSAATQSNVAADYYDEDAKFIEEHWKKHVRDCTTRVIPRDLYWDIVRSHMQGVVANSDWAINIPQEFTDDHNTGLIFNITPDKRDAIRRELYRQSKPLHVQGDAAAFLEKFYETAKKQNKEQSAYIVFEYHPKSQVTKLYLQPADVESSSATHVQIRLGRVRDTNRIVTPDKDYNKHVIGHIHTHYLETEALINMTSTNQGLTRKSSQTVMRFGVSDEYDVPSAKDWGLVVYAIDYKYIHKALPDGTKRDKLSRRLSVLTDALDSYGRRYPSRTDVCSAKIKPQP